VPDFLQSLVLLGAPGLLLGSVVGAFFPRWKVLVPVAVASAVALWLGIEHLPDGSDDEDDDPVVLLALAMFTNFGGWLLELVVGAVFVRLRARLGRT
jgi:hypothetical protein